MNDYARASQGFGAYPDAPGWKDRDTAKAAAEGVAGHAKGLRARVYDSIKAKPSTPEEVATALGEPLMNVRPRCSELATKGLIVDTGARHVASGGRQAIVWKVADGNAG